MTMIVREMILLDRQLFDSFPKPVDEFSDDSGWLGPPRSVPFAWEVAPGTPKHDLSSSPMTPSKTTTEEDSQAVEESRKAEAAQFELAMVAVDSGEIFPEPGEIFHESSGRHSIHILDKAFFASRHSEVGYHQLMSFRKGSVPFKWEMEPGIPRDPDKCREFLNCPLTPPPVLHSRSMIVQSSRKSNNNNMTRARVSISDIRDKMRSFFHEHSRRSPAGLISRRTKKQFLLKSSSEYPHSEEEDLSPVSVLDYNNSVRFNADTAPRLSSASSSAQSCYYTPKGSFSWDNHSNHDLAGSRSSSTRSSFRSRGSKALSRSRGSFSSLLMQMHHRKKQPNATGDGTGCLMLLAGNNNRSGSFRSPDEAASDCNSTVSKKHAAECQQKVKESESESEVSVYESPEEQTATSSDSSSGSLEESRLQIVERVDSLDTIDPGFAPSEHGGDDVDGSHHHRTLNRMVSLVNWQKRQPSSSSSSRPPHKKSHFARNLVGVLICCYVPHRQHL